MPHTLKSNTLDQLLVDAVFLLEERGKEHNVNRKDATGKHTTALYGCWFTLTDPRNNVILNPYRKINPFAQMYESMWIMAGDANVKYLETFVPRARDFVDEILHLDFWRAGYGPRIRNTMGLTSRKHIYVQAHKTKHVNSMITIPTNGLDQLAYCYEQLNKDPQTRQAVINIWDGSKDAQEEHTKDRPCNDLITFWIEDGKLEMKVDVRSNDVLWGFSGINVYEWTFMQQILANKLRIPVGNYHHVVVNFHMYEAYADKVNHIVANKELSSGYTKIKSTMNLGDNLDTEFFTSELKKIHDMIDGIDVVPFGSLHYEPTKYAWMFVCYKQRPIEFFKEIQRYFSHMEDTTTKVACFHYFHRQLVAKTSHAKMTVAEVTEYIMKNDYSILRELGLEKYWSPEEER